MMALKNQKTSIYILTETHMGKLDELITELQAVYCDIYANRELSVTSALAKTPASGLINATIDNNSDLDDFL